MGDLERLFGKHLKYAIRYSYILPRVAGNYFRLLILRQKVLRGAEFALTYDCNCHCSHCSAAKLRDTVRPLLSLDVIENTLDDCVRLGVLNINLTGGEILLRQDLDKLVRAARPRETIVSVATNGILFDRSIAFRLKRLGVRIVTISLDSADPEVHDRSRGYNGCFNKVFEAVEHARAADLEVFLCTIMTPTNLKNGDIYRMVRLAEEKGLTITVNVSCAVGGWTSNKGVLLDEKDLAHFDHIVSLPHVRWEGGSNYLKEGCPAGVEKVYISPYGDVMPCNFAHVSFGNVAEESFTHIWKRMVSTAPFNQVHHRCLVGTNSQFMQEVLAPLECSEKLPLSYKDHPAFTRDPAHNAEDSY